MAGPRLAVAPPAYTPSPYGLWSVVNDRSAEQTDVHWRNGVRWYGLCGQGGTFYDDSCLETSPAAKSANIETQWHQSSPFVAFASPACDDSASGPQGLSPVGWTQDELRSLASEALTRVESWQVERAFWTGTVGGDAGIVYPHLAASAATVDTSEVVTITLQCATTAVSGSAPLDITEGLGRLESLLGDCLTGGQGVIHVPLMLGEMLFRANAVKADGQRLRTQSGNLVALGAGYPGSGPDGTDVANVKWIYGTGPVFGYRSAVESFRFVESFDRSENTARMIAERTYTLGFDCCCLYAVPISVGGIVTGQPLSPF